LINGTSANGITYDYGADGYYENYVNCANDTDNNWTDTVYFSIISPPASNITDCAELTIPNHTYYLTQNIIDTPMAHCMDIQANNVTLDCEGHTINGDNMSSEYGIFTSSYANAVIHNCVITDWLTSGIRLESSINTIIYNNTLEYNYDGIDIYPTSDAKIYSNHFYNNGDGIDIEGGDSGSLIYNNYFSDYFGEYIDIDNLNYWNTTKQSGARIFSPGPQIGGNYWGGTGICTGTVMPCEDILNETSCNNQLGCDWFSDGGSYCENSSPMGPAPCWYFNFGGNSTTCNAQLGCSWATGGYSDNCIDANKDGFCDQPFDVYYGTPCTAGVDCSNNTDYLPLSNKYVPPTPPSPGFGGINCTVMNLIVIFSTLAIVIILIVLAYGGQTNPALAMLVVVPMLLVLVIAIMNLVNAVC
jgi:parallel beta-helix repeat protein